MIRQAQNGPDGARQVRAQSFHAAAWTPPTEIPQTIAICRDPTLPQVSNQCRSESVLNDLEHALIFVHTEEVTGSIPVSPTQVIGPDSNIRIRAFVVKGSRNASEVIIEGPQDAFGTVGPRRGRPDAEPAVRSAITDEATCLAGAPVYSETWSIPA